MLRNGLAVLVAIFLLVQAATARGEQPKPGSASSVVTQGEFAMQLVAAIGWQAGLPEEPKEHDYLAILSGKRLFRYEAEESYDPKTDDVTLRTYNLYGPFSGRGWLSGVSVPSEAHFTVFIPREGDYLFKVSAKGDGQKWRAGDREFEVSTGGMLREAAVGTLHLQPGSHTITAVIPPEGAVDFLSFEAPPLPAIEPLGGWRFKEPLRMVDVAEVAAALLGLENQLPYDPAAAPVQVSVAEAGLLPPAAKVTSIDYLGAFLSRVWVRADFRGARLEVPLKIQVPAVYSLRARFLGDMFVGELAGKPLAKPGKPYLEWVELGLHRLAAGGQMLAVQLPPSGGIDVVELRRKKSTPADYMALAGISGEPEVPVGRTELTRLAGSLAERFKSRR